jgi:hypothetical protein
VDRSNGDRRHRVTIDEQNKFLHRGSLNKNGARNATYIADNGPIRLNNTRNPGCPCERPSRSLRGLPRPA